MARLEPRALDLYVVTTGTLVSGRAHGEIATAAVEGGATAVQLRAPELSDDRLLPLAAILARTCGEAGVLFLVNDRIEVAIRCDAAGAHVGQDQDLDAARGRLGPERILGVSVGSEEEARAANAAGADYLGVTVWETATKPEASGSDSRGSGRWRAPRRSPWSASAGSTRATHATCSRPARPGSRWSAPSRPPTTRPGAVRELRSLVDDCYEDRRR